MRQNKFVLYPDLNPCRLTPCEEGSLCVPRSAGTDGNGSSVFNYTCTDTCMRQASGFDYRGSLTRSRSGKTCALWREAAKQHPYLERRLQRYSSLYKLYIGQKDDIETTAIGETNYCRGVKWDIVEENVGPWCYVTANNSELVREMCDVDYCPDAGKFHQHSKHFLDELHV